MYPWKFSQALAWASVVPKGLGERRFFSLPFSLSSSPFPPRNAWYSGYPSLFHLEKIGHTFWKVAGFPSATALSPRIKRCNRTCQSPITTFIMSTMFKGSCIKFRRFNIHLYQMRTIEFIFSKVKTTSRKFFFSSIVINRTFKLLATQTIRCISLKCKVQEYEVSNSYQKMKYWIMKKII